VTDWAGWDAATDEALGHLRELIRLETVNPPGHELPAARYLHGILAGAGIESRVIEVAPGRGAVTGRIPGGAGPLLLLGHLDVVGVAGQRWSVDPFAGEVKDGCVYGRGAIDDKGMLAANLETMLIVAREVADGGVRLTRDVVFAATADEETGGALGTRWLLDRESDLARAAFALNEGGRIRLHGGQPLYAAVQSAEKVPFRLRLTARGPGGHSMAPRSGDAISRLARALSALASHREPVRLDATTRALFAGLADVWPDAGQAAAMRGLLVGERGGRDGGEALAPLPALAALLRNTVTPTTVGGGTSSNVVPAEAWALLDLRLLPGERIADVVARLAAVVDDRDVVMDVEPRGPDAPPSPADSPMFAAIAEAVRELSPGLPVVPYLSPGATESAHLRSRGIPCFGLLPFPLEQDDEERMHGPDERLPIAALRFGVRLVHGIVRRLAATW
jgi:acetylornithine deacetylase/succinyl-diaminopimelate desuccinylase-like protein